MSLYWAIGRDEYSYASTRYSVVRIGVGERRKRGGREGLGREEVSKGRGADRRKGKEKEGERREGKGREGERREGKGREGERKR